jgi:peroxiredoxin
MGRKPIIILFAVALVAGSAGYQLSGRLFSETSDITAGPPQGVSTSVAPVVGEHRPDYRLGSSTGQFVSAGDFDGQVVLVNFWATWCKPCREEMPMLSSLQEEFAERGLTVVGIALDDVEQARQYAASLAIEYPILVGSGDVMVTLRKYGNLAGTLPYSVLIDRQGIVRWAFLGPLERQSLQEQINPLL